METGSFQRARRPEQISVRRQAILSAAAELFDAGGPAGAGLNAIAARAGFTKSNVYRYFESREEVLLSLYLNEVAILTDAMEAQLAACTAGDLDGLADAIAQAMLARPRFCRLVSIVSLVLERNLSEAAIIAFKRAARPTMDRLTVALHRAMPAVPIESCGWAWTMIGLFVVGLWPAAHPAETADRVLSMAEFADMKPRADRDLRRGVLVILRGVSAM